MKTDKLEVTEDDAQKLGSFLGLMCAFIIANMAVTIIIFCKVFL